MIFCFFVVFFTVKYKMLKMKLISVTVSSKFYVLDDDYFLQNVSALTGQNIRHPNPNEYLYVVSFIRADSQNTTLIEPMCIGTLVTRKDVLTAEHCVEGEELPYTAIVAGSSDFRTGTRYPLFWWLTYDWWLTQFETDPEFALNDICVVRVSSKFT
jgi:hypothetical protein